MLVLTVRSSMLLSEAAVSLVRRVSTSHALQRYLETPETNQRIACGISRVSVGIVAFVRIEQHINEHPEYHSPADYVPVCGWNAATGSPVDSFVGVRPKIRTWPMLKHHDERGRVWATG